MAHANNEDNRGDKLKSKRHRRPAIGPVAIGPVAIGPGQSGRSEYGTIPPGGWRRRYEAPGFMKPIELTVGKLHKEGVDAITLWPFILYRRGHRDDIALRAHEHFHWRQAQRWGVLPWYLWYLALVPFYFRKPSQEHPLERPAYELQWQIQEKIDAGTSIDAELAEVGLA